MPPGQPSTSWWRATTRRSSDWCSADRPPAATWPPSAPTSTCTSYATTTWSARRCTARRSTRSTGPSPTSSRSTATAPATGTSAGPSPTRRCCATRPGGRITEAVRRQATVDDDEQCWILVEQDRLDGYLNFAYRALKNARDGRLLEARLDAAESLPWLLDVVFALAGRLRPYNKYLPWELREHPLAVPEWSAEAFLPELELVLAGDPAAQRRTFAVVDREVRAWDAAHGTTVCGDLVDDWDERELFDPA